MTATLDKETVRRANRLEDVFPILLGVTLHANGKEPAVPCFLHKDGGRPNLRINLGTQQWYCDVCQTGGDVFRLVELVRQVDFPAALRWLAERTQVNTERRITATYDYADGAGALLFQVVRYDPKDFRQRRPDGKGGWIDNMQGVRRVPFALDKLHRLPVNKREALAICEGEKDCLRLWEIGIPATSNAGGAGKWTATYSALLKAAGVKRIAIIPDNDDTGRTHAAMVARMSAAAGLEARMVALPDLPPKGDVSDYLQNHSKDDLLVLLKSAPVWSEPLSGSDAPGEAHQSGLVVRCMADVQPEEIDWVWRHRFARGKISLVLGDMGVGKSTLLLDATATITRGAAWPDGEMAPQGNVVILSCEDGLADTIRPRLDRQGADVRKVFAVSAAHDEHGGERPLLLERDLPAMRALIEAQRPVLVVIDPLSAYFGTERDSYRDTDVRAVLSPLAKMAEDTGTSIVGLIHPNKATQQKALYRAMGSQAFAATARIVLGVGKDPDVEGRCFLMPIKQNVCPPAPTLAYSIGADQRLVWESEPVTGVTVDAVMSGHAVMPDEDRDSAVAFLRELLSDGQMPQREVKKAAEGTGWTMPQLRKAMKSAGVKSEKSGFRGGWFWRLAIPDTKMTADDPINSTKMTLSHEAVIFGGNPPVSPLDSTLIPKVTAPSSSASSSAPPAASTDGWGEV